MKPTGVSTGTETGTPTVLYGVPVAGVALRAEVGAPLIRWEKSDCPTVYFYARGATVAGEYVAFPPASPGPEFVRVAVTGVVAAMGLTPDTHAYIRRDDPLAATVEVLDE